MGAGEVALPRCQKGHNLALGMCLETLTLKARNWVQTHVSDVTSGQKEIILTTLP